MGDTPTELVGEREIDAGDGLDGDGDGALDAVSAAGLEKLTDDRYELQ